MDILVKNGNEIQPVNSLSCMVIAGIYSVKVTLLYQRNVTIRDLMLAGF